MSIRLRLTLWYTAILAVTLLFFCVVVYLLIAAVTNNQSKEMLREQTAKVYQRINYDVYLSYMGWDIDIQLDTIDELLSREIYLQVVNLANIEDSSRIKVQRSENAVKDEIVLVFSRSTLERALKGADFFETHEIKGFSFLIYNKPLIVRGKLVGVLQAAVITSEVLGHLRWIMLLASLITVAAASSLGWFLARKALKPIDNIIAATERIEKGEDLSNRIVHDGPPDEIGRLVQKINGMLSRIQQTYNELEESYRAQRRFVSDASHELRTPLTTIRGNVDLLEKMWKKTLREGGEHAANLTLSLEALEDIAAESERMSRLVNDLLSLARADAGYEIEKTDLELKPVVEDVVRKAHFLPRKAEWIVGDLSALDGVRIYGNKDYIEQLLFIFIENAFKYTDEGEVRIDAVAQDQQIGIRIADTGIGMDKEEIPHIFDRFYRADVSRGKTSGTGLGLSIAKWIIDEHRGSVEVRTRKGEGSEFTVWLPLAARQLVNGEE
jgi:signal transduction histidine kinase/flagellar basal body-associated protein FliL